MTEPALRSDPWLVVGLGNPGTRYAGHRHNFGRLVAEELARECSASFRKHPTGRADVAEGRVGAPGQPGPRLIVVAPRSYMNDSGGPVAAVASYHKVGPERIVLIHDELDLPFPTLRVKRGGGDNGHNGLRSVRSSLGTGEFYRVRGGVGRPPGRRDVSDHVLSDYSAAERRELPLQVGRAVDAVIMLAQEGLERTQSAFNS